MPKAYRNPSNYEQINAIATLWDASNVVPPCNDRKRDKQSLMPKAYRTMIPPHNKNPTVIATLGSNRNFSFSKSRIISIFSLLFA
ncbi:MAG: hypothetical protein HC903_11485 [Methylacidiphilales bacterium]|nr:hypothetical protein [Candidatus Methylacidiphilales bacterium]NJR14617.1 hypothetical protein [Calothrix sp. CSU_2_0]